MADPIRIRIQATADKATVRVLMSHAMETGQRMDSAGRPVAAWFIRELTVTHNGAPVMTAQWGPSVSKNPSMLLYVKGAKTGDRIGVAWIDNRGQKRADEAAVG